jgi:translation initiation factor 1 (eIF-1/SUI1)
VAIDTERRSRKSIVVETGMDENDIELAGVLTNLAGGAGVGF